MEITWSVSLALYAAAVVFGAYLLRGIAGFGSALLMVPFLSLYWPLQTVVPAIALLDLAASAIQGLQHRRLVSWRDLLGLAPGSLIGVLTGLFLLTSLKPWLLRQGLGILLAAYAVYSVLPVARPLVSQRLAAPAGFLGGLVSGMYGTGGPLYVLYLSMRQLEKGRFRATAAAVFLLEGAGRVGGYAGAGLYTGDTLGLAALGLPLFGAGLWLGGRFHPGISPAAFRLVVSGLVLMGGVVLLSR